MAFEQMRTFLGGGAQESLGTVTVLQPDGYPLLASSDLRPEHERISELIQTAGPCRRASEIRGNAILARLSETDSPQRTRYCFALIERSFAYHAKLNPHPNASCAGFFDYGAVAEAISILFGRRVEAEQLVTPLLEWFTAYRCNLYAIPVVERLIEWIRETRGSAPLTDEWRRLLIALRAQFTDVDYRPAQIEMALEHRTDLLKYPEDQWLESAIDALIGTGPWLVLAPCEVWATEALKQIEAATPDQREHWFNLLKHCQLARSIRPSAKWLKTGLPLLDAVGSERFVLSVISWFERSGEGRVRPTLGMSSDSDQRLRMHEVNAAVLRGLLWLCPTVARPELIRGISKLCFSAFRKVPGWGTRALKVGNAAIYTLGQIDDPLAFGQLALLRSRVKLASAQKAIEKAFAFTAERSGLSRDELEEMSVPTFGLTAVGAGEEKIGGFTARLNITGTESTELSWTNPEGAQQRSVPLKLKTTHTDEVKQLLGSAADIEKTLPSQRDRMDTLFLQQRSWPITVWRERYLDHALMGTLARRLLWEISAEDFSVTVIAHEGHLVDLEGKRIPLENSAATVRLWHPMGKHNGEIAAWREWLESHQIQQPFKQAHRELYAPNEAEREARNHTARFAGHIVKQHQFHALCAARGWKYELRRMVEGEFSSPSLLLPHLGLRAELSVEGIGSDYGADGADTNEHGVYLRVGTGPVRFFRIDTPETVNLDELPPLIFSEVMRDVGLFIEGATIGNDPTWSHGGPQGRHRQYWQNYAFGELTAAGITRKEALQRIVPRLKIAELCQFEELFLTVKGSWRTYKIHLGSGNVFIEPNEQPLCIAVKQNETQDFPVLLPFEGDRILSAIISKAFLLANDTKITDASVVSQIMQPLAAA